MWRKMCLFLDQMLVEKVSGHEYGYGTPGCVPIFCLGMQISVIELARFVLGMKRVNAKEF